MKNNIDQSPQARRGCTHTKRWRRLCAAIGVGTGVSVILTFLPGFQASGSGYKPWLENVLQFIYFLDRPLQEAGISDSDGKLLLNVATVTLWSVLAGATDILKGRESLFPVSKTPDPFEFPHLGD